jgi:hypothetical protein
MGPTAPAACACVGGADGARGVRLRLPGVRTCVSQHLPRWLARLTPAIAETAMAGEDPSPVDPEQRDQAGEHQQIGARCRTGTRNEL